MEASVSARPWPAGCSESAGSDGFFSAIKGDAGAKDVGERFAGIGDERVGMAEDARNELGAAEAAVGEDAP